MSQFPGQGSLRTLGLLIKVSLEGGDTFDRLQRLMSKVNEQVAKINANRGEFGKAVSDISERQSDLLERSFRDGPDSLQAQAAVNSAELTKQSILKQQEAALIQQLRLRGNLQTRLGQELTVLAEIKAAQSQNAQNLVLVNQLETLRLDLLRKQEGTLNAQAKAEAARQATPARAALARAGILQLEGDNVGALSVVRAAQDQAPAGSKAALALRREELTILRDIRREEKAADDARIRALAEQARQIKDQARQVRENNVRIARGALSEAGLKEGSGDASGAIGVIAQARGKIQNDQILINRLLKAEQDIRARMAADTQRTAAQQAAAAARAEATLLRRNGLEVRSSVLAGDYVRAVLLIEQAQSRVNKASEAHLTLENRRLAVIRAQAQAEAATLIGRAKLLESQGRRQEAAVLISGAAAVEPDSQARARLTSEHLRLQKGITREAGEQKTLFQTIGGAFVGIITALTKIQAVFYVFRATFGLIGGAINDTVFRPLIGLTKEVLTVTDAFRKFEVTFAGISGSLRSSRDIVRDIVQASEGLPITPRQALESIRQTAFVPAISSRLNNPAGRQEFSAETLRTIVGLGTINPTQGPEGAGFAIREALAGQFRSLRTRFDISPDVVAASVGARLDDLRRDPQLTLRAIGAFVNTFVGPEVFEQMKNTLSTQGVRFRGLIERFFRQIGEVDTGGGGLFDKFVARFRAFNDAFDRFISPQRGSEAEKDLKLTTQRVSIALEQFFNTILDVASNFLSAATGSQVDLRKAIDGQDFKAIGDIFASFIEVMGQLAAFMVRTVGTLTDAIGALANLVLPDPAKELDTLRQRALGVEDRDGTLFERGGTRRVAGFDPATGQAQFEEFNPGGRNRSRTPDIGLDQARAIPTEQLVALAQGQQDGPGRSRFIDEAGIARLQALSERFTLVDKFAGIGDSIRSAQARAQPAAQDEAANLDDAANEILKSLRQRMASLRQAVNLQADALRADETGSTTPNTIQSTFEGLKRSLEDFDTKMASVVNKATDGAAVSIREAIDEADAIADKLEAQFGDARVSVGGQIKTDFEGVEVRSSANVAKRDELRAVANQARASVEAAVRESASVQLESLESRLKELSLEGSVREFAAFVDEFIAVGEALKDQSEFIGPQPGFDAVRARASQLQAARPEAQRGGTGFIGAIPEGFRETPGQLEAILGTLFNRVGAGRFGAGALESARADITLAQQRAGGLEDVAGAADRMEQALGELRQVQGIIEAFGPVLAKRFPGQIDSVREAIKKSVDAASGELLSLHRRQEEISRAVDSAVRGSQRQVVDASLAARERALESIESEPERIAAKTEIAIEKIGLDAERQLEDLELQFKAMVAQFGGGVTGLGLAAAATFAKAAAIEQSRDIQIDSAKGAGDAERDKRERSVLRDLRSQILSDTEQFMTEREKIIAQSGIRITELEEKIADETNAEIIAGYDERIRLTKLGQERLLRAAEEAAAAQKSGQSQQSSIDRLLGDTRFDIRSSSQALEIGGTAPKSVEDLQRLFGLIESQRAGAVRAGELGLSGGLNNQEALAQAIKQIEKLREVASDPGFIEALNLRGVDPQDFADRFSDALASIREEFDNTRRAAKQLQVDIAGSVKGTLGDVVIDTIKNRGDNLAEIFENIGLRIVRAFADAVEQILLMENLTNGLRQLFGPGAFNPGAGSTGAIGGSGANALPSFGGAGAPKVAAHGMVINAAQGVRTNYGILTRPQGLVGLADGRIARTVEDGHPEAFIPMAGGGQAIIPMRGGGVPVVHSGGDAHIPLPSAPGGRIPVRMIGAASGAFASPQMGAMAMFPPRTPVMGAPAPVAAAQAQQAQGDIVLNIVNTADPEAIVRRAAASDPGTFVNPVVANNRGRGVMRRSIRQSRR